MLTGEQVRPTQRIRIDPSTTTILRPAGRLCLPVPGREGTVTTVTFVVQLGSNIPMVIIDFEDDEQTARTSDHPVTLLNAGRWPQ